MPPTLVESRSSQEFAKVLEYYRRHRAVHALPEGWYEDVSGLEDAAKLNAHEMEPDAFLTFSTGRWRGVLRVIADLYDPTACTVYVHDESGDGLDPWELSDLLCILVGIDCEPAELETAHLCAKVWEPDGSWTRDLVFTYPPTGDGPDDEPDDRSMATGPSPVTRSPR